MLWSTLHTTWVELAPISLLAKPVTEWLILLGLVLRTAPGMSWLLSCI